MPKFFFDCRNPILTSNYYLNLWEHPINERQDFYVKIPWITVHSANMMMNMAINGFFNVLKFKKKSGIFVCLKTTKVSRILYLKIQDVYIHVVP